MRKSKPVVPVVAVVLVAGLAYAGTSHWLGGQIESRYNAALDQQLSAIGSLQPGTQITRSYQRGMFTSEAQITLTVPSPPTAEAEADPDAQAAPPTPPALQKPLVITIDNHIQHGPLAGWWPAIALIASRLGKIDAGTPAQRAVFDKVEPPRLRTVVHFGGGYDGTFVLPAGEFADGASRAKWQQLDFRFNGAGDGRHVEGNFDWPQLSIEAAPKTDADEAAGARTRDAVRLQIEGMTARFDSEVPVNGTAAFGAGTSSGTIKHLSMARGDAPKAMFELDGVQLASTTRATGALFDVEQTATGRGTLAGKPIDRFDYAMALTQLNGEALKALEQALFKASATPAAEAPTDAQSAAIAQALNAVVQAGPSFRSRLKATIGVETGEFSLGVTLPTGAAPAPADLPPAFLMLALAQQIEGNASMKMPKSWVPLFAGAGDKPAESIASAKALLGNFTAQGWLVEGAADVTAELKYAAGAITVNGRPFNPLGLGAEPAQPRRRQQR
ncbi:YdgA family protein [Variovorax sp. PAMC 28711]|uniref:YdgA family protein n=1 Tax=Variovorax sp. PAMC 28711 TaxID=1795631 RepID=UPI00078E7EC3|nr:DUF945 family protein [Variovorax sp. PAMC 28711]AMM25239.1 hypothetical protein AX767_13375 [Variovorax sp. PAMC 28711]